MPPSPFNSASLDLPWRARDKQGRRRYIPVLLLASAAIALAVPNLSGQAPPPATMPNRPVPQSGIVVILDPAHGGTDPGARGPSGVLEKEVVLNLAQALQTELERQGLRVLLTRKENENPSFDDRAALANAQQGGLFISLHVSSTGAQGTVRTYYFSRLTSLEEEAAAPAAAAKPADTRERPGLLRWDEAQEPYAELSRRLAELLQVQCGQKFQGSPEVPAAGAVRQLRLVSAPAVALEISNVSVADRTALERMGLALAQAVARAVAAFRPLYEAGAH